MEKYDHRVESGCSCAVYSAHDQYLDNAWFTYHGYVLREAGYEI